MMRFFKLRTLFGGLIDGVGHQVSIATVCVVLGSVAGSGVALGQTVSEGISNTQSSTDVNTEATTNANPTASIVVQSISGGSSMRATPNAPGLASFAGGPCIGTSMAASSAIPGVSFGGGVSKEDESCQRRNWIQTLIGASQHMSPEDSLLMTRLAFQIMREDKYLAGPMARVGIPLLEDDQASKNAEKDAVNSGKAPKAEPVAHIAPVCTVVVPSSRPEGLSSLLALRGCAVVRR